jgi:hypothetical protein
VAIENSANLAPLMETEFFIGKIIFWKLWPIDLWISHHLFLGDFEREYTQEQLTDIRNRTKYVALRSRITEETLQCVAPNKRKESVVDISNTYYITVIFYNFEVLFFKQNEHLKALVCLKFCSYHINEYYITIWFVV